MQIRTSENEHIRVISSSGFRLILIGLNEILIHQDMGINYVSCVRKDIRDTIHYIIGKPIGDCSILITETLTTRKAVNTVVQIGHSHCLVESDSKMQLILSLANLIA